MPRYVRLRRTAPRTAAEALEPRMLMDATTGIPPPVAPGGVPQGTFIGEFGETRRDRFAFTDRDFCKVTLSLVIATAAVYRDGLETHIVIHDLGGGATLAVRGRGGLTRGRTRLGNVIVEGDLRRFHAPRTILRERLNVSGNIGVVVLRTAVSSVGGLDPLAVEIAAGGGEIGSLRVGCSTTPACSPAQPRGRHVRRRAHRAAGRVGDFHQPGRRRSRPRQRRGG